MLRFANSVFIWFLILGIINIFLTKRDNLSLQYFLSFLHILEIFYFHQIASPSITFTIINQLIRPQFFITPKIRQHRLKLENIIIAKTQNQLKVMYNQEFQQIIQLNASQITIDNNYNLIYWFDEIAKELIFYKISYPKNVITPSKNYIYMVGGFQIYNQTKFCIKIKYKMENQYNKNQTLEFNNQCQNKSSIFYSKEDLQLPNKYEIKPDQNSKFRLNILDQYSFKSLCPKLQNFNPQDTILLYYEADSNISFSMIQTKDYIYFQNCHNATKSKVDIQNCQVFYFQSYLLLYNKNKQEFNIIDFQGKLIKRFKIQVEITQILQCQQIILIFASDGKDPKIINLQNHQQILLNNQSNNILNTLHQIYLQDKQKNQKLTHSHFFLNLKNPTLIQYNQYLIILINKRVKMLILESIQIIFLKQLLNQYDYFVGVHLISNSIIDYHFDKQQISSKYLALAALSQTKTYVLIVEIRIKKPLLLVKAIQIGRIEFFISGQQLFYYNFENEIEIYNLRYFEVQLQDFIKHNQIAINANVTFEIISETKRDPAISLGFTLKGYNECFKLFQKSNHSSIDSTQKQLMPYKYFQGPIDILKIEGSDGTNILEPLMLIEWIDISSLGNQSKIKKIDIGPILYNNQSSQISQIVNIILAENGFGQTFIINRINLLFARVLPINQQQILIFFMDQVESRSLKGAVYSIDEEQQCFGQKPILEINITLEISHNEYNFFKTGDLIIIKSKSHLFLYLLLKSSIQLIENNLNILDILKVQGNNQFYISFSEVGGTQDYQFNILTRNELNLVSTGTAILSLSTIFIELQAYIQILLIYSVREKNYINLLECEIIDSDFRILAYQIINQVQIITQIDINMENYSISFKMHKLLSHGLGNHMNLQFYSKNYLILKSKSSSVYFYDLTQPSNFIDHFGRIRQSTDLYYPFNTTHLYIYQATSSQIFLGELGYNFDTKIQLFENQTFTLVAENQVSQARCSITIIDISYQQVDSKFLIKFLFYFYLFQFFIFF
ncbi:unnamed protein product [Paramecium octaurelia]|uniref:Transmembrane protein n=1 Tax=Paramecium octaurelia TaxID=43137 RepID=A0A8S1TJG5_PAROT|nr:unnamed protein product [Paramecium octaurelia]